MPMTKPNRSGADRVEFPEHATTAGTIWIVIGVGMLIAFGALFYLVAIRPGLTESGLRLGMWLLLGGVLAGGLIWAGTQTVRGAAHSILVNGVGSLLLAPLIAWLGMVF